MTGSYSPPSSHRALSRSLVITTPYLHHRAVREAPIKGSPVDSRGALGEDKREVSSVWELLARAYPMLTHRELWQHKP